MGADRLQVQMLGRFVIRCGDQVISDDDNRSRKIWLMLAYMICCRNRAVAQSDLTGLCWSEQEQSSDPFNALKTIFHRARTTLDRLGDGMGRTLILRKAGNYSWNNEVPLLLDIETFESLCRAGMAEKDEDKRLHLYRQALELYAGDFLPKLSAETWVVPIAAYYHNLYVQTVLETAALLEKHEKAEETAALCRKAIGVEPFREELYQHLIRSLAASGDKQGAIAAYEEMSELFFSNFGVMPSDELRRLYRDILCTVSDRTLSMETLREELREKDMPGGAMICEYDFFRIICHAAARALSRSGNAVHICLLSVTAKDGGALAKRSLELVMENLQNRMRSNLRRGDVAARCSVSQFIVMLPQANYENSCMVCDRLIRSFYRQYPHTPAKITYSVQPLEPTV